MAKKSAPKKSTKKAADPVEDNELATVPLPMPTDDAQAVTAADDVEVEPIEEAPELTKEVSGEAPPRAPRADVVAVALTADKPLPTLGRFQQFFESPDGRVYIGPADQHSIPDPENPKREINPMRRGGINR